MQPQTAFAMYKPHPGQEETLMALVKKHLPTLREFGLVTDRDAYLARSQDGTFIEIFEWKSADSARAAHEHPGVAAIWEAMGAVADFPGMSALPEAAGPFPNFESLAL
ncbi:hypothetical protein [Acanthopleuribacter pedis]|uniref:ABM domain-containing protein n=1 Tax=Acanthopleuribacter pedis TaxID=442870 RepID=A0A8J7Q558_9BACT|nr:hypothetical protein [Acanthopleuribacter pedis]MBO1318091.1 hypothetical protein [Acanthopleuribacter pedis]